ncbi:Protein-arginine-phosphatase [Paenibacillus plantiphilus]|uniref:Protein-arginine-phosphatase n=1 Tax=Paenibacillus plantiphilus TaxID=2905650 RepID=A0ABN8G178_9BACL|nr:low molecular weight protein arginine phosphatase [Paenibacillus plantiphilus]CAH1193451.1 Protein-arginine-phosphatase [Paenibacillus plantiphilus]
MKRILFVCTGNTCRSPMAEAMLREMANKRGLQLEVRSAGVSTMDGLPVSTHAQTVLRNRNYPCSGSSMALDGGAIGWADLILTMTTGHKRNLLQRFPQAVDKVYTLVEYVANDESALTDIAELETLYSEWQMKQALGQQLDGKERGRLLELERRIPSFDIADPFGGSIQVYERSANEIEQMLLRLLDKLAET